MTESSSSSSAAAAAASASSTAAATSTSSTPTPFHTFPFPLDPFQQEAIAHISNGDSVLVTAHTSAGKTAVAEFAVARALKQQRARVIYTSPIKALSNQKYQQLREQFGDVGLITGDVVLNESAGCLIMTTEVLRNMLYKGAELLRELAVVVFDEVHYMRNRERGVVWEESIILLPASVPLVFLSATLSNAQQFAAWVSSLKERPCHVVSTLRRPTPLHHYLYAPGVRDLYLVLDNDAPFRRDAFREAMRLAQEGGAAASGGALSLPIRSVVEMLMDRKCMPIIVFCFSRRETESRAMQLARTQINSPDEVQLVDKVFNSAVMSLSEADRQLPQIRSLLPMLRRGIGVHHSGLLPILKEVVEILFQESLLKVLFATETFAMGVNMPARTVVFCGVRKFDGTCNRMLTSGEYIQMSGRAGRRGIDDKGLCVLMTDDASFSEEECEAMLKGAPDALTSQFRLRDSMILNLMRIESIDPDAVIAKSFYAFDHRTCRIPEMEREQQRLEERVAGVEADYVASLREQGLADQLEQYVELKALHADMAAKLVDALRVPELCLPFLTPGRVVRVQVATGDLGWGVVLNVRRRFVPATYVADVLVACTLVDSPPVPKPGGREAHVVAVELTALTEISALRMKLPHRVAAPHERRAVLDELQRIRTQHFATAGVPVLQPGRDFELDPEDLPLATLVQRTQSLDARIKALDRVQSLEPRELAAHESAFRSYLNAKQRLADVRQKRAEQTGATGEPVTQFHSELKARCRVLRRLGYVDDAGVLTAKGRVACNIESCDELVLTEMIFAGVFSPLSAAQTVALLTCLFEVQKRVRKTAPVTDAALVSAFQQVVGIAQRVGQARVDGQVPGVELSEYIESFSPVLVTVTLRWCEGASFAEVAGLTSVFEGTIVRTFRRMSELLSQLVDAAKALGDEELQAKFTQGAKLLERGIIFAASLYLT